VKYDVSFRPNAVRDVDSHAEHYRQNASLAVANKFYDAIDASVTVLRMQPQLGELCSFVGLQGSGIRLRRVQGFGEYVLFYTFDGATVEVVRVLHGKQDIDAVFA
jgi:toxin ParE1/3/4